MIEILTNIQNYFIGHYTQWILFIIIILVGYVAINIINRYMTQVFEKVDSVYM